MDSILYHYVLLLLITILPFVLTWLHEAQGSLCGKGAVLWLCSHTDM